MKERGKEKKKEGKRLKERWKKSRIKEISKERKIQ